MGNVCATSRNKECLYSVKHPNIIKESFNDCVVYRKKENSVKILKKKKRKLLRKIDNINCELEQKQNFYRSHQ